MAIKQIGILLLVIVASEYPKNNLICVTKSETRKQRSLTLSKKERKHYGSNMCEKRNWNWNQKSRQFHRSTSPSRLHNNVKRTLCVESGIESKPPSIHSISPDSGVKKEKCREKEKRRNRHHVHGRQSAGSFTHFFYQPKPLHILSKILNMPNRALAAQSATSTRWHGISNVLTQKTYYTRCRATFWIRVCKNMLSVIYNTRNEADFFFVLSVTRSISRVLEKHNKSTTQASCTVQPNTFCIELCVNKSNRFRSDLVAVRFR